MMRSMFAGVSALRNHQIRMDVIGNNIANVNTIGYKASRVTFQDLLSQTMAGASAPDMNRGGTNPQQVGLGVGLAAIWTKHTPGNLETTGVTTDLAIQGNGFFILGDGNTRYYTRAGMFGLDEDGWLVAPNGMRVMGWSADTQGNIQVNGPLTGIQIPEGQTIQPRPTTSMALVGNLDVRTTGTLSFTPITVDDGAGNTAQVNITIQPAGGFNEFRWTASVVGGEITAGSTSGVIEIDETGAVVSGPIFFDVEIDGGATVRVDGPAAVGALEFVPANGIGTSGVGTFGFPPTWLTSIDVYDSLGVAHTVHLEFTRTANNTWEWTAFDSGNVQIGDGDISFNALGQLVGQTGVIQFNPSNGANPLSIIPDFTALTLFGEESTAKVASQDGFAAGTLTSFDIDTRGVVRGIFSNGLSQALGQVATATFTNPSGLLKEGDSLYQVSANSGQPDIGVPGTGGRSLVAAGNLEMSNVDLSEEFTNMIVTQRGFQANSRIITTSDEMLQELVNLKR